MFRKIVSCTLLMLFACSIVVVSAQSTSLDMTILAKTVAVENILYGTEQTGALVDRISKLEKDVYGLETRDSLIAKVDQLYTYMKETSTAKPSFTSKLNAVEWTLTHAVTTQPVKARLENLEHVLLGNSTTGSFNDRLNKLLKLAYSDGQMNFVATTLAKDTLIKITMVTPLSTKTNRPGDAVVFQAADDVYVGGALVIAKGAQGFGKVTKIRPAKNFGRDAELGVTFDSIEALDSSTVNTVMGEKAKEETKSLAKAAGATVAGLALLGPIGIVGGIFVQGQEITIPTGSELYIQTKDDAQVFGVQVK
ncbi:MAG TPA: hypothetical protein VGL27_02635 [Negativicutes bacterium]